MSKIGIKKPVYWECVNSKSRKFWMAHILKRVIEPSQPSAIGASPSYKPEKVKYILVRKWGRIGVEPQRIEQEFDSKFEAQRLLDKLIWAKEQKGYEPIF